MREKSAAFLILIDKVLFLGSAVPSKTFNASSLHDGRNKECSKSTLESGCKVAVVRGDRNTSTICGGDVGEPL